MHREEDSMQKKRQWEKRLVFVNIIVKIDGKSLPYLQYINTINSRTPRNDRER